MALSSSSHSAVNHIDQLLITVAPERSPLKAKAKAVAAVRLPRHTPSSTRNQLILAETKGSRTTPLHLPYHIHLRRHRSAFLVVNLIPDDLRTAQSKNLTFILFRSRSLALSDDSGCWRWRWGMVIEVSNSRFVIHLIGLALIADYLFYIHST
ncbi:hypothetical protein SISSUDRAFT_1059956 [Sistotremastrum suecicum HHB10207 ss-3]|uniref:Uncharacterized protein n=1 Tax=Sistotremastrum suecicum HHB10207 ss-3 TaxID=1314776 RepID=A0A166FQW0_9AGAM|nr:hypothetical protein SISSUDRAFT_1059956 [Sistotremastrum suecicum HHB10207 ss-3]